MNDEPLSFRLNMIITPSQVAAIDAWRKQQENLFSRSEAIRRLVAEALEARGIKSAS